MIIKYNYSTIIQLFSDNTYYLFSVIFIYLLMLAQVAVLSQMTSGMPKSTIICWIFSSVHGQHTQEGFVSPTNIQLLT